jgi:hypothetical protein
MTKNDVLNPTVLTEHIESDGSYVPMNVVIVDPRGQAAGTLVTKDDARRSTIN